MFYKVISNIVMVLSLLVVFSIAVFAKSLTNYRFDMEYTDTDDLYLEVLESVE